MPKSNFTADKSTGCLAGLKVNFKNTSADNTIIDAFWNFGDGTSANTMNPDLTHNYSSGYQKTFFPTLTVYDAHQCISKTSLPISLLSVNGDFQADDNAICEGGTVAFRPLDINLDSAIWSFGDGTSSFVNNNHIYTKKGWYTVKLTASKYGCRNSVTKNNYISVEMADASFQINDSVLKCYPDTVNLLYPDNTGSPVTDISWIIDSKDMSDHSNAINYVISHTGNIGVQLKVKTLNGCQADKLKNIVVTGPTANAFFTPKSICFNGKVDFELNNLDNVNSWKWMFGDGAVSNEKNVAHTYTSKGIIVPGIILTNPDCKVTTMLDTLTISYVKAGFLSSANSSNICAGSKLSFTNTSDDANIYSWKINNVTLTDEKDLNEVELPQKGENIVKLIAFNANCTDTFARKFVLVENPVFTIAGDSILCKGQDSITLKVNSEAGWKISWTPVNGLGKPTSFITKVSPEVKETYTAHVTDIHGCNSSINKTILVNELPSLSRFPPGDTTINIGDTIRLSILADNSDLKYLWTPAYNISCPNCSNPVVSPFKNTTYNVEISNNCVNITEHFIVEVINNFYLEAPSAFTPNGDSNNDAFKFESKNIKDFDLKIFNRWGKIVFATHDINEGWDGTVNGKMQNADTYVFFVKASTIHGFKFEKKGNFLLLK